MKVMEASKEMSGKGSRGSGLFSDLFGTSSSSGMILNPCTNTTDRTVVKTRIALMQMRLKITRIQMIPRLHMTFIHPTTYTVPSRICSMNMIGIIYRSD